MHIHCDYTVFDMINCREYITAVSLNVFFNQSTAMTTENKETIWLPSNSEDMSLKFLYIWMNGKTAKITKIYKDYKNHLLILRVIHLWKANTGTADMGHII